MSFPEDPLVTPVVVDYTSDKARATVMRIDAETQELRVEFTKGAGTGAGYAARANDNTTVRNLPDDENGDPQPQEWDIHITGTEIATWVMAQGETPNNGAIYRRISQWILQQKGVIS